MRLHTFAASVAFVALLAARAPAGDDAPKPPKKDNARAISEEEWIVKVKDVARIDAVGVKKKDVLAFEARKAIVLVRSKIWDVRPTQDGIEVDIMEVMPVPDAIAEYRLPRDPILLPAEDAEAVKEWKRWDRLTFKVKPKVTPDGALQYERIIESAADVGRIPNPGVEYPPVAKPLADTDSFADWVDRYARACCVPDWRTAWKYYTGATSRLFPVTVTVRQGALDRSGRGPRAPVSLVFDIVRTANVSGYGLVDSAGHPSTSTQAVVDDPQVAEALKAGARAELYFRVHGFESSADLETHRGRFRVDVTFGRLR
jgi:hypothetical protein